MAWTQTERLEVQRLGSRHAQLRGGWLPVNCLRMLGRDDSDMVWKIRDTRAIRDTHLNTCLAGDRSPPEGIGPRQRGPVPKFRQSNGPRRGPVPATDSAVWDR